MLRPIIRSCFTMSSKLIDIGANLTDTMYQGEYHGSKKHEPDLDQVLDRSWNQGLDKIIITGGSLQESKKSIELAKSNDKLYATVGCHPTRCNEFDEFSEGPEGYLSQLKELIETNKEKVVAIGECGLDNDRINFCDTIVQKKYFELQLQLCQETKLPLFLHCRAAGKEMLEILQRHNDLIEAKGVIHSFDGTLEEAQNFIELGYFIGINGCSLKTEENLKVVKELPLSHLLIETDAPWCEIRPTHASSKYISTKFDYKIAKKPDKWVQGGIVKGRNEPCFIKQVLDVVCGVKDMDRKLVEETIYKNTMELFFKNH